MRSQIVITRATWKTLAAALAPVFAPVPVGTEFEQDGIQYRVTGCLDKFILLQSGDGRRLRAENEKLAPFLRLNRKV